MCVCLCVCESLFAVCVCRMCLKCVWCELLVCGVCFCVCESVCLW